MTALPSTGSSVLAADGEGATGTAEAIGWALTAVALVLVFSLGRRRVLPCLR